MSPKPNLSPMPPPEPAPSPAAAPARRSSSQRAWIVLALLVVGAGAAYKLLTKSEAGRAAAQTAELRTARASGGSIRRVLRLTGSTIAKNFRSVAAPMVQGPDAGRGLVLTYVATSGSVVKKGDLVAQIDAQALKDHVEDLEAQIVQSEANIRRRQAEIKLNEESLQQNLRVAKARLDKARLDASAAEIRTPIDAELIKLNVEESAAAYQAQVTDLPLYQSLNALDLRIIELDRELQVRHRNRHRHDIEAFTIRAPIGGLVVMQSIRRAGEMFQIREGDQIAPAQPFMKIVDTNSMQVQAVASQVESDEMRLGQNANITFDAFPGLKLKARVANIGAIATPGSRTNNYLRNVPVFLSIVGADTRIIPDLSTSNDVIVEETGNSPLIPLEAVELKDGKSFVRVKARTGYQTREVKLGMSDNIQVAVIDGVREGEEVALDRSGAASEPAAN